MSTDSVQETDSVQKVIECDALVQEADPARDCMVLSGIMATIGITMISCGFVGGGIIFFSTLSLILLDEICKDNIEDPIENLDDYDMKDYPDLTDPATKERLLTYLDSVLSNGEYEYLSTVEMLKEIDPRIHLCIANTEIDSMVLSEGDILVPVHVEDTMIIGVEGLSKDIADFIEMADPEITAE